MRLTQIKLAGFKSFVDPTLHKERWTLPDTVPFGEAQLKPLRGGETLNWKLA